MGVVPAFIAPGPNELSARNNKEARKANLNVPLDFSTNR
jgi:hypothetical protein